MSDHLWATEGEIQAQRESEFLPPSHERISRDLPDPDRVYMRNEAFARWHMDTNAVEIYFAGAARSMKLSIALAEDLWPAMKSAAESGRRAAERKP